MKEHFEKEKLFDPTKLLIFLGLVLVSSLLTNCGFIAWAIYLAGMKAAGG